VVDAAWLALAVPVLLRDTVVVRGMSIVDVRRYWCRVSVGL